MRRPLEPPLRMRMSQDGGLDAITTEQFDRVMKTNVYALFWLCKAAVPHLPPGSTIITRSSVQAFQPSPHRTGPANSRRIPLAAARLKTKPGRSRTNRIMGWRAWKASRIRST
jgi:NAD(P)-dependent dehydrogenase (short-subunit alcohol dehydrogenase family)